MALAVCLLMRSAESLEVAEGSRTVASLGAKAEAAAAPRITIAAAYLIIPSGWYKKCHVSAILNLNANGPCDGKTASFF